MSHGSWLKSYQSYLAFINCAAWLIFSRVGKASTNSAATNDQGASSNKAFCIPNRYGSARKPVRVVPKPPIEKTKPSDKPDAKPALLGNNSCDIESSGGHDMP